MADTLSERIRALISEEHLSHDYCRGGDGTDYIDFEAVRYASQLAAEAEAERQQEREWLREALRTALAFIVQEHGPFEPPICGICCKPMPCRHCGWCPPSDDAYEVKATIESTLRKGSGQ